VTGGMGHTDPATAKWVAIQRNPKSGSGARRFMLVELVSELKRLGFRPRLFKDRSRLEAWIANADVRAQLACIVAAGGDGTAADVFNRFPGVPIALLPLGTENLLARYLGIPASGKGVARMIAGGRVRVLDLCRLGERKFVLLASAGFDAEVIERLHQRRSGHISRLTYFQPILESLRKYQYPEIRVWIDDAPAPVTARWAAIVNVPIYALGFTLARGVRDSDGTVDVRLFRHGSAFQMAWYLCNVALGIHERLPDVESVPARRIRIESDVPVPIQVDGDPAGWTPAEISVVPAALQVIVPDESRESTG
jgi:diacylglycerol kinase family enzyme